MSERFPRRFVFLRHGQTDHNANGIVQGQLDIPLNHIGRGQAVAVATLLTAWPFDRLVVSDLARAVETARLAADNLGLEPLLDARLRERHFGPYQGKARSRNLWLPPDDEYEAIGDFVARNIAVLEAHGACRLPLFIGHGGFLRAFEIAASLMLPPTAFGNVVPLLFTCDEQGGWAYEQLSGSNS